MGGVRVIERSDYLVDFLRERGFHEMRKARHEYLSYYGFDQEYVFVLVEGVVKASVTLREGTRFNISYIKGPSPVSLLRDEVSSRAKSPLQRACGISRSDLHGGSPREVLGVRE